MRNQLRAILFLLFFAGFRRYGFPQATPSAETWQFDVASIKVSSPNATVQVVRIDFLSLNRLEAQDMTVVEILRAMIGFSSLGEVCGGLRWVESTRYDISAKCGREVPPAKRNEILTNLLQSRFTLVIHNESLEKPGVALILSPGSTPGLQMCGRGCVPVFGRIDNGRIVFQSIDMFSFANYLSQMLHPAVTERQLSAS